ncbi:GNAT family N-acetyltransferase [Wolbachia endosymbiont (group A) of Colletes cunicularius]|uniref:GNAT family N-acetyltransferase n=1 Tax=Wolbachia endosymbiont (group A) of Colletes cunicularius TaxID=3139321 RepID=UPI0035C8AD84
MVEIVKNLNQIHQDKSGNNIEIKAFTEYDTSILFTSFAEANWPKSLSTFETYLQEQKFGERIVWTAFCNNEFAGYVTLKWCSEYKPFQGKSTPEVMDLNVLPLMRNRGIGSTLLETAEKEAAKKSDIVGLGVGLHAGYGAAQKLYIKRGYIPDSLGVTYKYQHIKHGAKVELGDDLVLWFTKKLK